MKKTILFILLFSVFTVQLYSQGKKPIAKYLKTWNVTGVTATADTLVTDTTFLNFQNDNLIDKFSIANSYNANMLSPIQSKIYFDRPEATDFLFSDAYFPYIKTIENTQFYNTKTPYSNIQYKEAGSQYRWEEQIKFLFTANAHKRLNLGATVDYIISHGEYKQQETQRFNASLFGSYDGRRYQSKGAVILNSLGNYENGGIENEIYITNPGETDIQTQNIPINITGFSKYNYNTFFYNQQYGVGFEKEVRVNADSVYMAYIPITRFIHTIKLEEARKRYYEPTVESSFYANTYFPELTATRDTAAVRTMTNTFAIHMEEEFNRWMKFGLTAYATNEIQQFTYHTDTLLNRSMYSNTKIGGVLSKTRGGFFRYNAQAELGLIGYKAGNFLLKGDLGGYFHLWKDSVVLRADGFMRLDAPSYFLNKYESNHFKWDNDFDPIYRTNISGTFMLPKRNLSLNVSVENILNYVYYNSEALPTQESSNVQVLAANLKYNLNIGKHLTWENNAIYQVSTNSSVLPLPALALFSNLYYHDLWFNVLNIQAGVNVRYHTAYYAPNYMPATGRFFVQDSTLIGNYPIANVYLNFKLYQARFFVEYYHINKLLTTGGNYFSMPKYPLNPAILRLGISVDFYN